MYDARDFQVRYDDHKRQMAWVNDEGWQFDPPQARRRAREKMARVLVTLATRLAPVMGQPHTAQRAMRMDRG